MISPCSLTAKILLSRKSSRVSMRSRLVLAVSEELLKDSDALRNSFGEVIPNFDRERVYTSDIKKLYTWYNILIEAGITDFADQDEAE